MVEYGSNQYSLAKTSPLKSDFSGSEIVKWLIEGVQKLAEEEDNEGSIGLIFGEMLLKFSVSWWIGLAEFEF